jgi:FMN-dependent NADH-azoreductase
LIEELQSADTIIIGAPMYNFSISSPLKAWIDQIVRVGKTLGYGPDGPRGLLEAKKVIVVTARGGSYEKGTAREAFDFQEPYHANNQAREHAARSLESAVETIAGAIGNANRSAVGY